MSWAGSKSSFFSKTIRFFSFKQSYWVIISYKSRSYCLLFSAIHRQNNKISYSLINDQIPKWCLQLCPHYCRLRRIVSWAVGCISWVQWQRRLILSLPNLDTGQFDLSLVFVTVTGRNQSRSSVVMPVLGGFRRRTGNRLSFWMKFECFMRCYSPWCLYLWFLLLPLYSQLILDRRRVWMVT
jgi:hypothetical protein